MSTIILCLEIFIARILDVSIGVIRTVELVKDNTIKAVILAFSKLTYPHGLFRGILLEQIYRSFKIINNETYHK